MAKSVLIDKEIGGFFGDGISAESVAKSLAECGAADEVEIVVDSPGGSVYEAISIFNEIRDFARKNPRAAVTTKIRGIAASAASYVAMAAKCGNSANKIVCEDNSVFMIHDAWSVVSGNRAELEKEAAVLGKIDGVLARAYCAASGMELKAVKKMMDDETWLFGAEIEAAGFADECAGSEEKVGREAALAGAGVAFKAAMARLRSAAAAGEADAAAGFEKVAALVSDDEKQAKLAEISAKNLKEEAMTVSELKEKMPELYDEVCKAGAENERARCLAHLERGGKVGRYDLAAQFVKSGAPVSDEAAQNAYLDAALGMAAAKARAEDNVPPVKTPVASANANAAAFEAAFFGENGGER